MSIDFIAPQIAALVDTERAERLLRIHNAWLAYQGDGPRALPEPEAGEPDDNVRLNFNRQVVDKGVAFLFGKTLGWGAPRKGAEEKLRQFWRHSGGMSFFRKVAKNGGVSGHALVKLQPGRGGGLPRAIPLDPSNWDVEWDDEDIDRVLKFIGQWTSTDESGKVIVRRQRIEWQDDHWQIIDEVSRESGDQWETIGDERWPFEWPNIFHCQNLESPNEFWGTADLEPDVLALVGTLEKLASDMKRVVRLYGHPKPWVSGQDAASIEEVDASIDALLAFPNDNVNVGQLEMSSELGAPIVLWRELKQVLHELTRIPEVATGKLENAGSLSGVALQILYQPLLEKTEEKRDSYGGMAEVIGGRALELMGAGRDLLPTITWPEMLPGDPQLELLTLDTAKELGVVSIRTISERLGFDYDQERERMSQEPDSEPEVPEL